MIDTMTSHVTSKEKILADINQLLETRLTEKVKSASVMDPRYGVLWETIHHLVMNGGKRLRPYLVLITYEMCAKKSYSAEYLDVAVAQELLHQAMLIHDDIIDRDDIRYGIDNVAGQYKRSYSDHLTTPADQHHFANSAALLAGDALISDAYSLLAGAHIDPSVKRTVTDTFAHAIFTVIGGELADTEASFMSDSSSPMDIAERKTASYSFVSPIMMGAQLSNASEHVQETLRTFAARLGIAYQIKDDLIGLFGNEKETGKSTESDIREGKKTLIITEFEAVASDEAKDNFYAVFGDHNATHDSVSEAKEILLRSGAIDRVNERLTHYISEAQSCLDTLLASGYHTTQLSELTLFASKRSK